MSTAKSNERKVRTMKLLLDLKQKDEVSLNCLSYMLFHRDPQKIIRMKIVIKTLSKILISPYKRPVYIHSMKSAHGNCSFETIVEQTMERNKRGVLSVGVINFFTDKSHVSYA